MTRARRVGRLEGAAGVGRAVWRARTADLHRAALEAARLTGEEEEAAPRVRAVCDAFARAYRVGLTPQEEDRVSNAALDGMKEALSDGAYAYLLAFLVHGLPDG